MRSVIHTIVQLHNIFGSIMLNTEFNQSGLGKASKLYSSSPAIQRKKTIKSKSKRPRFQLTGKKVSDKIASDIELKVEDQSYAMTSSAEFIGGNAYQDATSAYAKAAAISDLGINNLRVLASTAGAQAIGPIGGKAGNTYNLSINGFLIFLNEDVELALTTTQLRDAINAVSRRIGIVASLNEDKLTLRAKDGRNIEIIEGGQGFVNGKHGLTRSKGDFEGTLRGTLSLSTNKNISIFGTLDALGLPALITVPEGQQA